MEQDFETRGKLGQMEDLLRGAINLFAAGELVECAQVLGELRDLAEALAPRRIVKVS